MGIKRLFYYFVVNTGTVAAALLSSQYLTRRLRSIVNNQSYTMDITRLSYYLTGTLNTSSTVPNGAVLFSGGGRGYGGGILGYAGGPDFSGTIPAGYKRIYVELGGKAYFIIEGHTLSSSTWYTFNNAEIAHTWSSSAEYIGNAVYPYRCVVKGFTN